MTYLDLDEDFLFHLAIPESWHLILAEQISAVLLEDEFVQRVFEFQKDHYNQHGRIATPAVLQDQFRKEGLELSEPEAAIGDLIQRLRNRYARNQGRDALDKLIEIQGSEPLALPGLLLRYGQQLSEIVRERATSFGTGDFKRAIDLYFEKVNAGRPASLPFPELDDYFFGMSGVNFILGMPGTMKSWMMCQTLVRNVSEGHSVWLYSLELPAHETDMRIRSLIANVPWWKYTRNALDDEDIQAIRQASEWIDSHGSYTIVKPEYRHRGIDEMVAVARDSSYDVILIDQLQYVENDKHQTIGGLNNTGDYWQVLNRARDLSDDGPILFAHQFSRQARFLNEMPTMEYAKGSAAVEEVATLALGLWADKPMRESKVFHIGTLKARNHEYATWEVGYEMGRGCSFEVLQRVKDDEEN